jgi:macrolide-specific efflux system membrane fusion protein
MNVQDRFRDPRQRSGASESVVRRLFRFPRRHPLTIFSFFVALAGSGYFYFNGQDSASGALAIATATRGDIEDVVTAVGNLQPLTSVDVGAQVSGQLKKFFVKVGDEVEKDQLLAEIDSSVMAAKVEADNAQLQNFQAQLLEKQSQAALAGVQADRQTRLLAANATSQDAYDSAQAAYKTAQAQIKSVEAQINQSQSTLKADQATLGYSKIYAPMAGTITAIPVKEGQTLNANQQTPTVLTVGDLSTMTVFTQVSEADVPKLRLGMDAYFTTLGDGTRRWSGKLRQILPTPTVVNNVVLYTALFDVANPAHQLMTQMTAQVFFVRASAHDVVTVPMSALSSTGRSRAAVEQQAANGASDALGVTAPRASNGSGGGSLNGGRRDQARTDRSPAEIGERAATLTVVKDDGSHEARQVVVGVTDRVNAAIISGLAEGERILAGTESDARPGRAGRGPARGPFGAGGLR